MRSRRSCSTRRPRLRLAALRAQQEADFNRLSDEIRTINEKNAVLSEDKAFFGLGGTKKAAREDIAKNQLVLEQKKQELADLTGKISEIAQASPRQSQLGEEFVSAKTKLRELLDISSEDHKRRQRELVSAAQSFVNTTEARVAGISNHFAGMDKQINNLLDANYLDARDLRRLERRHQGSSHAQRGAARIVAAGGGCRGRRSSRR